MPRQQCCRDMCKILLWFSRLYLGDYRLIEGHPILGCPKSCVKRFPDHTRWACCRHSCHVRVLRRLSVWSSSIITVIYTLLGHGYLISPQLSLTHWGRVTHICVNKLTTIGSDNGLSPGWRQVIIWTNAGILLIWNLGTNFSEISSEIQAFSFKKMHLKMSSAKWRPFVSTSMC